MLEVWEVFCCCFVDFLFQWDYYVVYQFGEFFSGMFECFDGWVFVVQCDVDLFEGVVGFECVDCLLFSSCDFMFRDFEFDFVSYEYGGYDVVGGVW